MCMAREITTTAKATMSTEEEFFGSEFFDRVAEFGGGCIKLLHCG